MLKFFKNIFIYVFKDDVFMLENDIFYLGMLVFSFNFSVFCNKGCIILEIVNIIIKYWYFFGYMFGCFIIEIEGVIFSGDFIFYCSIGCYDFFYFNEKDMKEFLLRF